MRIERRLRQPRWLLFAVPAGSIVFAFFATGIVLLATGHDALSSYRQIVDAAFLNRGALGQTLTSATPARLLSGGNVQKVVLAREFSGRPQLLVAASPTRGLDVGAIETVHAYLRDAAADGVAVLLISEDLDEILVLADRIAVMYEGAILGETTRADASVEELGLLMAGGQDPRAD